MLFQELGKLKRTSIMFSIVLIALGLIMIICPPGYAGSLIDVLGYVSVITAIVMILEFLSGKRSAGDYIGLTVALLVGILGLCMLVFNDSENTIIHILGWIFGLFLILDGAHSFANAFLYSRRSGRESWWVLAVLAGLLILCGLIMILSFRLHIWTTPKALLTAFGWLLLFSSAVGIVRLIWVWPIKNEEA